jgi:hypothetical protein
MSNSKVSISTSGLVITIYATGLVVFLHYTDVLDFPVVATYLDWITACIYHAVPALAHLPLFILASLIVALVFPAKRSGRHGRGNVTSSTAASKEEN